MAATEPAVFVLDEDPAIQDSLAALLHVLQLPAEFFATVKDFLDVYDSARTGCLLLDLRLPGNGFMLLEQLCDRRLPIIVITGHGDIATREKAMKLGAVAFFEKPFNAQLLCDTIRQVMAPVRLDH